MTTFDLSKSSGNTPSSFDLKASTGQANPIDYVPNDYFQPEVPGCQYGCYSIKDLCQSTNALGLTNHTLVVASFNDGWMASMPADAKTSVQSSVIHFGSDVYPSLSRSLPVPNELNGNVHTPIIIPESTVSRRRPIFRCSGKCRKPEWLTITSTWILTNLMLALATLASYPGEAFTDIACRPINALLFAACGE